MNELQIFNNEEFGEIRAVKIDDEPWFVGKDVAQALGYKNTKDAIATHIQLDDKRLIQKSEITTLENNPFVSEDIPNRGLIAINESGLYSLIFGSKLENAKRFKHWVTSEVLPNIRKNGGYIAGQETMTDDELLAKALMVAQNKIAEKNRQIEAMRFANGLLEKDLEEAKPKTVFADAVSTSHTTILIGDLAKLINQNGIKIGQKRLFEWLREKGYLIKYGASKNMPTQKAMEQGLFKVKERAIANPDGSSRITRTTLVTGKGQVYFINKFLNRNKERKNEFWNIYINFINRVCFCRCCRNGVFTLVCQIT